MLSANAGGKQRRTAARSRDVRGQSARGQRCESASRRESNVSRMGCEMLAGLKSCQLFLHVLLIAMTNKNVIITSSLVHDGLTFFPEDQRRRGQARQTKQNMKQIRPDQSIPLLAS